jgi:HAD superfamily hydrolase (TIGR01509 family)
MIDWKEVDTVLLDMDGTLLDLHFDNYFWLEHVPKVYSRKFELPLADATHHLYQLFDSRRGTMEWYCIDYWSEQLQLDIARMKHDINEKIAVRPHVPEFLDALRKNGKQIILVTNAHRSSLDLKMQKTGLGLSFDAIVSAHDYGMPKEKPELWKILQSEHHFLPSSSLLVDDTESVLDSARSHGIRHLITISQPDSRNPVRSGLAYPAILHFDEIMPDVTVIS